MNNIITAFMALVATVSGFFGFQEVKGPTLSGFGDTFLSIQLATDPDSGECLTTNGTDNSWSSSCGGVGGGDYPFTPTTVFGTSTSATTSPMWFTSGIYASSTSVFSQASTTQLSIGSDFITDLSTGLAISATGVVTVDDVSPSMLQATDFGHFTCNGTTCSIDANTIGAGALDESANFVFNGTITFNNTLFAHSATSTLFQSASSTIGKLTVGSITSTSTLSCDSLDTDADGKIICGTDTGAYPFTPTSVFGTSTSATTTPLWLTSGLFASSTSRLSTTTLEGSFGIGTTSPEARFVVVDGNVIFEDLNGAPAQIPFAEYNTRNGFFWVNNKESLVIGGYGSSSVGYNTLTISESGTAENNGNHTIVVGKAQVHSPATYYGLVGGNSSSIIASGTAPVVWGTADTRAGGGSAPVALGVEQHAFGDGALSIGGDANTAYSYCSIVGGLTNLCFPEYAGIFAGNTNTIFGAGSANSYSVILGGINNQISAPRAMTLGNFLHASTAQSILIGSGLSNAVPMVNNSGGIWLGSGSNFPTMVIASTSEGANTFGKVGIGTTSPYAKLSVVGETVSAYFTATTTATSTFAGGINSSLQGIFGTGLTVSGGQITAPVGSLSQPSYTFAGDTDTGIYRPASNGLGFSAGGGLTVTIDANSLNVLTTGTLAIPALSIGSSNQGFYRPNSNEIGIIGGNKESARFDASNRFGIGTTSPFSLLSISATSTSALSNITLFAVSTSTATATSTAFFIDKNGNVGIGTTTPARGLAISGNIIQEKGQIVSLLASSTANVSGLTTIDFNQSNTIQIILSGNASIVVNATSSNTYLGGYYKLNICQDGTGGRVVTWAGNYPKWLGVTPATTTIPSGANKCIDVIWERANILQGFKVSSSSAYDRL